MLMALDSQEMFPGTLVDATESLLLPLGNPHLPSSPPNYVVPSDFAPTSVPQSVAGRECFSIMSWSLSLVRRKGSGGVKLSSESMSE